jgi:hypothetical protein
MFAQGGAEMNKVLTTVAGLLSLSLFGAACSAVDTQETTSTTPVSIAAVSSEAIDLRHDPVSRSVERPKAKPTVKAPLVKVIKPTVKPKHKVIKPIVKTVKPKKVYHKTVKVNKKVIHKIKKVSSKGRVSLSGIASCIAKYESGGNPRAQNPSSTASGLFQFLDSTWRAVTGLAGRAMDAPVSVQIAAFYKLWNGGRGANQWTTAHKCGW